MLSIFRCSALLLAAASAQPVLAREKKPAANPDALAAVTTIIKQLSNHPIVRSGTVGFYLAPLDRPDQPLLKQNARQSFITASTMKTLTTGSALEILGPDYQFSTTLSWQTATGDLIISGSGDPTLGRPDWNELFDGWTQALRTAGLTEIRGRILADESAWQDQRIPDGWTWLDMGNYYAPVLTPLCFHDNAFRLYFNLTGSPGSPAGFYDADPWPQNLEFTDRLLLGEPGTGDKAYLSGAPGTTRYVIQGTLAADAGKRFIRGALPDPALFCAQTFTAWLNARQIPVHGTPTTTRRLALAATTTLPAPAAADVNPLAAPGVVAIHRSAPLRDLLIPINHRSLNLDCECLLRTLGKGSDTAGLLAIRQHLAAKNLPLAGYEQTDGSGLSRTNMITPELMARANAAVLTGRHAADFLTSLPQIGTSVSTLRKLSAAGPAVIRAKSGSIERVKSYTGQVTPAAGPGYIFAVLVNNYDGPSDEAVDPRLEELFDALSQL